MESQPREPETSITPLSNPTSVAFAADSNVGTPKTQTPSITVREPSLPGIESSGLTPKAWGILIGYTATLFFLFLGPARSFTAHEGLVVEVAQEMIDTGDWLVPRIAGNPFPEKFPLHYWAVAALGSITGDVNEFVARIPSALCGLGGVLLIAGLIGKWFGSTKGLITGLIQTTTVYTVTYSRLAECDIYLWFVVIAALVVYARNIVTPEPTRWYSGRMAFFFLLGLVQLIKGPLFGAVLIMIPTGGYAFYQDIRGNWKPVLWFCSVPGWIVTVMLATGWPLAVWWSHPEVIDIWWLHTFGRFNPETCIGVRPWWYYFTTMPWQMSPWTLAMFLGMPRSLYRLWKNDPAPDRFLWMWFGGMFCVLSAVTGKHHHYLLHAMPPCAFFASEGLLGLTKRRLLPRTWYWALPYGLAVCGWIGFLAVARTGELATFWWDVLILGIVGLAFLAGILWSYQQQRHQLSGILMFAILWMIAGYVHGVIVPKADNYRFDNALLRRLSAKSEQTPVLMFQFFPMRELAYIDSPVIPCDSIEALKAKTNEYPRALILTSKDKEPLLAQFGTPIIVDQTPGPRPGQEGPRAHLVIYRIEWANVTTEQH
ncbi:MAG: ArnT family glycosyltransferase [Gemmataceae bacterium]